jgi:hypothetical protein
MRRWLGTEETKINCNDEWSMDKEDCKLKQFQRNLFYNGKLLTASDFNLESSYFNEKRHIINRLVLGSGIVCGLKVIKIEKVSETCYCGPDGEARMVADRWRAEIEAGVALDCIGREIVCSKTGKYFVSEEILPEKFGEGPFGCYIRKRDSRIHPTPTPANTSCCEEVCCYSHLEESFELVFDQLPQITKLVFDSTYYAPKDAAFVYFFRPLTDEMEDPKEVMITTKSDGRSTKIILKKLSESTQLGVDIYVSEVPFEIVKTEGIPIDEISAEINDGDVKLSATASIAQKEYNKKFEKRRIGRDYYEAWLRVCECCNDTNDPKVLLASLVFGDSNNFLEVDEVSTIWHRNIVYNNKMLYDLISCHLVDLEKTTTPVSTPVRAIERLSIWRDLDFKKHDIGNLRGVTRHVPEIRFIQGNGIELQATKFVDTDYDSITISSTARGTGQITSGICEISKENFGTDYGEGKLLYSECILSEPIPHGIKEGKIPGIVLGIRYPEQTNPPSPTEVFSMEDLSLLLNGDGTLPPLNGVGAAAKTFLEGINSKNNPKIRPFYKAVQIGFETFRILVVNKFDSEVKWETYKPIIHWWAVSE